MGRKINLKKSIVLKELATDKIKSGKYAYGRKIKSSKMEQLKDSIKRNGNYGVLIVDAENNLVSGHQRLKAIKTLGYEKVQVVVLSGYSEKELKTIAINENMHNGEFIKQELYDEIKGLSTDLQAIIPIDFTSLLKEIEDYKQYEEMELSAFEKYDYLIFVFKNEHDINYIFNQFNIQQKKITLEGSKKHKVGLGRIIKGEELVEKLRDSNLK